MTEEPYKIPHFAALLRALDETHAESEAGDALMSKLVLDDFWKGFQAFLDKLAWREVRLCVSISCFQYLLFVETSCPHDAGPFLRPLDDCTGDPRLIYVGASTIVHCGIGRVWCVA